MSIKLINDESESKEIREYEFYSINGKVKTFSVDVNVDDSFLIKELTSKLNCAYMVKSNLGEFYFIKYNAGEYFDITEDSAGYRNMEWSWKKVKPNIFNLYKKFLNNKSKNILSVIMRVT